MSWDIAIVGAGPYGLSIAAHLGARGKNFQIFGPVMQTWRNAMPRGMYLKSEGFASSLYDPGRTFTLAHHCTANGIPYADTGLPVALDTFTEYCTAFQQRFAPHADERLVANVEPAGKGFKLRLSDGEETEARTVIVAAGITHFAHMPLLFRSLPADLASHSADHRDLSQFAGREMIVVGAGASALDIAALLLDSGASVRLISRRERIRFHEPPTGRPRTLIETLRAPMSGLGPGWRSRLCTDAPMLFHLLPGSFRAEIVRRHLGAAPGWWTKPVETEASLHLGQQVRAVRTTGGRITLELADRTGRSSSVTADHVIAATGYRVDLDRLAFLSPPLRSRIRTLDGAPQLNRHFGSTVPGLHFVGVAAANSFGPMMRFAFGAGYTASRLANHLAGRGRAPARVPAAMTGIQSAPTHA